MACPIDGATLVMSERSGIEIDYCPTCRGVWLDRGELDKIIERSAAAEAPAQMAAPQQQQQQQQPGAPWGHQPQAQYGHGYGHKPYKRRKSFLEELFD
jgi:Zn-finger nucleic acid-binding protein